MRNHERCASSKRVRKRFLDEELVLRIKMGCRLIENDNLWIFDEHAGDRESLLFSA